MEPLQENEDIIDQYVEAELENRAFSLRVEVNPLDETVWYREPAKFIPLSTTYADYAAIRDTLEERVATVFAVPHSEKKKPLTLYISVTRFAELRQVNRSTVIAAIDKGFLQANRTNPGGMWRIEADSIPAYLRRVKMTEEQIDKFMEKVYYT